MSCRNMFLALLITISSIFLQGCGGAPIQYVQAYYDKALKESEVCWVAIGDVLDENGERVLGKIEVKVEELPDTIFSNGFEFCLFEFPAGDRKFQVKCTDHSHGTNRTKWFEITKSLEGGKCYIITDRLSQRDGGFLSGSTTWHTCKVEKAGNSWGFSRDRYVSVYDQI